ncbi:helix-turn-helix transcriptional regulator [Pseudomonas sp. 18175]|uniref:helix-turn-helix transcriptional regulator n=1 Tax=Pseudomonas sp. 18175 TaxID=3390056 RepID=UPI003D19A724
MSTPAFNHTSAPATLPDDSIANYSRFELAPGFGQGWTDIYRIGHGITLARGRYDFAQTYEDSYTQQPGCLTIKIMTAGELHLQIPEQRKPTIYRGNGVMLRHARDPQVLKREMVGHFSGVSIDVPESLLEQLFEDQSRRIEDSSEAEILLNTDHACHAMGLVTAATLLTAPVHTTVGRLQIEAAALQMVASLVGHEPWRTPQVMPNRHRVAVADACDILQEEFSSNHSIASLARRVGLNECYLKSAFKVVTGQTIASYLRQVRMQRARTLIESGHSSVLQACQFVGYSNPGQFAAAFRRSHGVAPASLKASKIKDSLR